MDVTLHTATLAEGIELIDVALLGQISGGVIAQDGPMPHDPRP